MTQTIEVNAVDRSGVIERKDVEWAEFANLGEVGEGRLVVRDYAGTIYIPGHKPVHVVQSSSTPDDVYHGFTHRKGVRRGDMRVGAGREIAVTLHDGNELLKRLAIREIDSETGKRPRETVGDRVTWLLASPFLSGLVSDFGAVTYPDDVYMDETDYQTRYPGDVLAECSKAMRFNHYVRWNTTENDWELVFRDDNASTEDTCTLDISNDKDDLDDTTLHPSIEGELAEDPEHVYSGALGAYAKGYVYEDRAATATEFVARDGVTEESGDKTEAVARRNARTFLWESHSEEQLLPLVVRVSKEQVGLIRAGMRVSTRMTHMAPEGWDPARYARILRLWRTQPLNTDEVYDLRMDLSPQEDGPPVGAIVQTAVLSTGPGGGTASFPGAVTIGNLLVYMGTKRHNGGTGPNTPNTDVALARWGAGSWTDATPATTRVEWDDPRAYKEGMKLYYKTADSTSASCYLDEYTVSACWEISGSTMAGATIVYQDLHATGTTRNIGSLGTPDPGQVALLMVSMGAGAASPVPVNVAINPGSWIRDIHADGYAHVWAGNNNDIGFNKPAPPETWIGHQITDGTALDAQVTDTYTHKWGGIAVLLPAV